MLEVRVLDPVVHLLVNVRSLAKQLALLGNDLFSLEPKRDMHVRVQLKA